MTYKYYIRYYKDIAIHIWTTEKGYGCRLVDPSFMPKETAARILVEMYGQDKTILLRRAKDWINGYRYNRKAQDEKY